jgi:hypothetical protein
MEGIQSRDENFRYHCSQTLTRIVESMPDKLLPNWDTFVSMLKEKNALRRYNAVEMIAKLTCVDKKKRFDKIFSLYFSLLSSESETIVPAHVARNAWRIVRARPDLEKKITKRLLDFNEIAQNFKQGDLIKAFIIQSFNEYYDSSSQKKKILKFVQEQLQSPSPKTRRTALDFLKNQGLEKSGTMK